MTGEECTMLRGKWLAVFSGIVLAIAGCGHASAKLPSRSPTPTRSQARSHKSATPLKQMQYIIDYINSKGGALGRSSSWSRSTTSRSFRCADRAEDRHPTRTCPHHAVQRSNIAAALIDAVNKHNERNPDNRIIS